MKFINEYQALIGSFLAIFSSLTLWYLKELYEKNKCLKNNKKEIEDMFLMISRDAEESVKDLIDYISSVRKNLDLDKKDKKFHVFQHSKFNKVYINEERIFVLKKGINFTLSQQIDIAVSACKKFNSLLEAVEFEPTFIFDSTIKLINTGIESKVYGIDSYKKSINSFFKKLEHLLDNDFKRAQINMLRPVVALGPKYINIKHIPANVIDDTLDVEAGLILTALKQDLK